MTPSAPDGGSGGGGGQSRSLLLLFVPGLALGVVAVAVWLWPTGGTEPTSVATLAPTVSATPTPSPTPTATPALPPTVPPTPTPDPTTSSPEPTSVPDRETVALGLTGQYIAEDYTIVYNGSGEAGGRRFVSLRVGTFQDHVDIQLFAGEPHELPDGRWLHLGRPRGSNSVGLIITLEPDAR